MPIAYINKTIPVPNITKQNINHPKIGDGSRTALGAYRTDIIDRKRKWRFAAEYITFSEYKAIDNYLQSILGGRTFFWYDEMGGNADTDSIYAVVSITNDERVQFGRSGTWYNDGRNIELEVIEV